jgi:lysozyme
MVRRRKRKFGLVATGSVIAKAAGVWALIARHRQQSAGARMPHDCPLTDATPGIDVSYYQGDISWPRVARAGIKFAFIRAADGTDIIDTKFEANWRGARAAKIPRGVYQYFRPNVSPIAQADVVIAMLRKHGMGELPPVIDVEDPLGLPLATVAANAKLWVDRIRKELHVEPIVYTNPGMWGFRGAPELATQTLWIAHYTQTCPLIPPPWTRWKLWQYSDNGRVDGISGPVDLDVLVP